MAVAVLTRALAVVAALVALGCDPNTLVVVGPPRDAGEDAPAPTPDAEPDVVDAAEEEAPPLDVAPDLEPPGPDSRLPPGSTNLIGYWPCDEGMGTHVADVSGQANHGTVQKSAAPPWGPGRVGSALDLSGNNWVLVPTSTSIDSVGAADGLTIAAWIWVSSYRLGEFNFIVSRQVGTGPYDNFGLTLLDGKPTLAIYFNFISAPMRVPLRRWIHVAVTYDGVNGRVFVDGQLAAQVANTRGITREKRPLLIGGNQNDASGTPKEFLDGYVDEVMLFNRALRSAEISTLYQSTP